jgi:hypothetical protein
VPFLLLSYYPCLSASLLVRPSVCLSAYYPHIHPSICVCTSLYIYTISICLSIYLSVRPSVVLPSIHQFIHPSLSSFVFHTAFSFSLYPILSPLYLHFLTLPFFACRYFCLVFIFIYLFLLYCCVSIRRTICSVQETRFMFVVTLLGSDALEHSPSRTWCAVSVFRTGPLSKRSIRNVHLYREVDRMLWPEKAETQREFREANRCQQARHDA